MRNWLPTLALLVFGVAPAPADDSPNAVIESSVVLLTEQLDGRQEELAGNREELYEIIDGILMPRFDRRFAAQVVLAKHWRTANEEQQARFIEAFYRALLRKYADGILEFDPEMITVLPYLTGMSGLIYLGTALVLGAIFLNYAIRMKIETDDAELPMRTFRFSITYLAILFAALLVDHHFLLQLII